MAEMVMPEERHRLPLGTVLQQRYQIQKVLGQGGFGITYLAWDRIQGESVAVKEFYPQSIVTRDCTWGLDVQCITQRHLVNFQSSRNRFLREADALQRFRNIHSIVDIRDYFEANNTAYIVMEYLVGRDLKDHLAQRGPLSMDETLRILEPVFYALTVVHRAGLVHRDISPDNIMLTNLSGAKLLDFGAVRTVEDPSVDSPLSKSTEAILKHGFAPIEQYNTRGSLGPWTDEYALCATIYYCLTGKVPVQPSFRISEKIEPEWDLIPGLTDNQRAALKKGMAIAPADRFPDVGGLYEALYHGVPVVQPVGDRTVLADDQAGILTQQVRPEDRTGRNALKVALVVLLSVLLTVLLGIGGKLIYDAVNDGKGKNGGGRLPDDTTVTTAPEDPSEPGDEGTDPSETETTENDTTETAPPETEHEHTWIEATYDAPRTCATCGATEGEPLVRPVYINEMDYHEKYGKVYYHDNKEADYDNNLDWRDLYTPGHVMRPVCDGYGKEFTYGIHMDGDQLGPYYITYKLDGRYTKFSGWCVLPDNKAGSSDAKNYSKYFEVYCDGKLVFTSNTMRDGSSSQFFEIDVTGVEILTIQYAATTGPNDLAVLCDGLLS